ncbi:MULTISPECIES: transposase [Flavobacterium]|uniref:Transposase n=1 Tax=Flavobacterium tructae TaxID=1114873 RepID=A0A1S1J6D9_9FLAO|nr:MULTISPECIES: transposase [Flavobacterium]MDL2142331.1 transposase [Flavobacterium tructae]OHT45308.1 hypothetical protein BHE19_05535 [Flavobacterium tructae]OXB17749.1 hypothetical protein B0A71_16405 [Flavobacterium tructae]
MEKPKQKYTLEFKLKVVELSNRYYSIIRAAKEVNTSPENIRRWKVQLQDGILGKKKKQAAPNRLLQLKILRKELTKVQMERDILRKAAHILSGDTITKFKFIKQHRDHYPIANTCQILEVSKISYYYWDNRKSAKRTLLVLINIVKLVNLF